MAETLHRESRQRLWLALTLFFLNPGFPGLPRGRIRPCKMNAPNVANGNFQRSGIIRLEYLNTATTVIGNPIKEIATHGFAGRKFDGHIAPVIKCPSNDPQQLLLRTWIHNLSLEASFRKTISRFLSHRRHPVERLGKHEGTSARVGKERGLDRAGKPGPRTECVFDG